MKVIKLSALFALIILSTLYDESIAADSGCGDWTAYQEDKCFKIIDKAGLQTYSEAEKTCHQQANDSSLISILFNEEQEFVSKFFKDHKVADNVWIGAKYANSTYRWTDQSEVIYTNWAEGSPKNLADHCAQFQLDETAFGKWSDVVCTKKNLVVCQKMQTWTLAHMQQLLLKTIKNPFPVGFTYVQLPKEKSPTEVWPWMIWKDVTADYAGLFFRAEGAGAGEFGKVQEEDSPRLIKVKFHRDNCTEGCGKAEVDIGKGVLSKGVYSGDEVPVASRIHYLSSQFITSNVEVRPKNMAIRIWKRAA